MKEILLDTNIVISYFGNEKSHVRRITKLINSDATLYLSNVTMVELISHKLKDQPFEEYADKLKNFLPHVNRVSVNDEIADEAGRIRHMFRLNVPDAVIAATAKVLSIPLITMDKDFKRLANVIRLA